MGKETEQIIGKKLTFSVFKTIQLICIPLFNQHKIISSEIENTVVESTIDGFGKIAIFFFKQ